MNQASSLSLACSTDSIPVMVKSTSSYNSTFLPKPIIKEQKGLFLQGKLVSIYNVELLAMLAFFSKSTVSNLSLYWQKAGHYYETINKAELNVSQLIDLLSNVEPHIISLSFLLDNSIEVDSNVKDEIFISYIPEKEQADSIACLYNSFVYATLVSSLKKQVPLRKTWFIPDELFQTRLLEH